MITGRKAIISSFRFLNYLSWAKLAQGLSDFASIFSKYATELNDVHPKVMLEHTLGQRGHYKCLSSCKRVLRQGLQYGWRFIILSMNLIIQSSFVSVPAQNSSRRVHQ